MPCVFWFWLFWGLFVCPACRWPGPPWDEAASLSPRPRWLASFALACPLGRRDFAVAPSLGARGPCRPRPGRRPLPVASSRGGPGGTRRMQPSRRWLVASVGPPLGGAPVLPRHPNGVHFWKKTVREFARDICPTHRVGGANVVGCRLGSLGDPNESKRALKGAPY